MTPESNLIEQWLRDRSEAHENGWGHEDYPPGKLVTSKIVCPTCNGTGTTWLGRHSSDAVSFTEDEWFEMDRDERDDWMAGHYDRVCPECYGKNVIDEVDWEKTEEKHPELAEAVRNYLDSHWDMEHTMHMERMMGA